MKKIKKLKLVIWALIISSTWGTAIYWIFADMPTSRNIEPVLLQNPFVVDDSLHYVWNGDVYRDCEGNLFREIHQNGIIFQLQGFEFFKGFPTGERSVLLAIDMAPLKNSMTDDTALYVAREQVYCNFLKKLFRVPTVFEYEPFEFTPYQDTGIKKENFEKYVRTLVED